MTPELQLFKPPAGAEMLAVPEELSAARTHIVNAVSHLMKLYGLKKISCSFTMFGPCGVSSPSFESDPVFGDVRPKALDATTQTMVRAAVPLLAAYGVTALSVRYDDKDRVQVMELWGRMANNRKEPDGKEKAGI